MPSTSAKQHRFMQAVAHSPSFAKKSGVSQSVGKDFSAADKGKTFSKGGMMKKGKRFNGDDDKSEVEYHDYDPDKSYSGRFTDDETGELAENTPRRSTAKAAPAAPSRTASAPARSRATSTASVAPFKANSDPNRHTFRPIRDNASAEIARKDRNTSGILDYPPTKQQATAPARLPSYTKEEQDRRDRLEMEGIAWQAKSDKLAKIAPRRREEGLSSGFEKYIPPKQKATVPAKDPLEVFTPAARARRAKELQDEFAALYKDAGKTSKNLKKGGDIMESKKMMGMKKDGMPPEVMAAMMAKRQQPMRRPPPGGMPPPAQPPMGMNKGGMPMKDGKPAFMQKKMMGGGMAYAKGGGIESRGKTKGTVIRMAAGGSVSSRADGIAQRGKTKFTNY